MLRRHGRFRTGGRGRARAVAEAVPRPGVIDRPVAVARARVGRWAVLLVMPIACRGRDATAGSGGSQSAATPAAAVPAPASGPAAAAPTGNPAPGTPPTPAGAPGAPAAGAPALTVGPRMTNPQPPFRYPAPLYARKVQGNVTLRLWVDSAGVVRAESTKVAEPSGYGALDSAAVAGAGRLRFAPALREGRPHATAVLFPVYFRHPEAPPLPGDTVLGRRRAAARP